MSSTQYEQYGVNPYSNAENGHGESEEHTDGQQHRQQYEMSNLPSQTSAQAPPQGQQPSAYQQPLPRNDFFKEVQFIRDELKDLAAKVTQIKSLHSRLLDAADSSSSSELGSTLTGLETNLLAKNDQIRRRIRTLEQDAANCTDDSKEQRSQQANSMKREFQSKLEDYMYAEKQYRDDRRVQIRRQYMIVNPEATDQELKAVADELPGSESEGIFQRALNNRSGQASSVLGAVRARHNEIQRIEQTLSELAQMFNDMAQLVVAQEPIVEQTEANADDSRNQMEQGNKQINTAIKHARNRNKLKWWCLLICILIILGIALGVGLGVGLNKAITGGGSSSSNNNGNAQPTS